VSSGESGTATPRVAIGPLLRDAIDRLREAGSDQPRLDAELLMGHVTGMARTAIIAHPEREIGAEVARRFDVALRRRLTGEPIAYIRGFKEFHGIELAVNRHVLIPRPETELLVELAARLARDRLQADATSSLQIVDVGTGSGAIAIALATELRAAGLLARTHLIASDASADALSVAAENLARHDLAGQIRIAQADLLPPGIEAADLILANLPYIPSAAIPGLPVAATFEPPGALDGGSDGLVVIRRLLGQLMHSLAPGGTAILEIGAEQAADMARDVEQRLPGWPLEIRADLSGLPRVAVIHRRAAAS